MGWQDYRLREFEAGERHYRLPDPECPDGELTAAKNVKLDTLIERGVHELYTPAIWGTTGGTPLSSRPSGRASPSPNIPATSTADAAPPPRRRRHPCPRKLPRRHRERQTSRAPRSTNGTSSATGTPSTQIPSLSFPQNCTSVKSPNAASPAKPHSRNGSPFDKAVYSTRLLRHQRGHCCFPQNTPSIRDNRLTHARWRPQLAPYARMLGTCFGARARSTFAGVKCPVEFKLGDRTPAAWRTSAPRPRRDA